MAIRKETIAGHIQRWETVLGLGAYPYRTTWPSRLFRHEPIENAVKVLRSGRLLSREMAACQNLIGRDIAPEEIIGVSAKARPYVRLYFRPMNPTQFHIEGIRKPEEAYLGKQAPVLIIFVFRADSILGIPNVAFSDGNMQKPATQTFTGDDEFRRLPFQEIYHQGAFGQDDKESIIRRRCAEVLIPSELSLADHLQAVLCRSSAERAFLLHQLGADASRWVERIRVFSKPGIFQNGFAYLDRVQCSASRINFAFHPRKDGQHVSTGIEVHDLSGRLLYRLDPLLLDSAISWYVEPKVNVDQYLVTITVDGSLAYRAVNMVDSAPF